VHDDLDAAGASVLDDIRQRLLHEPVGGGLQRRRQSTIVAAQREVRGDVQPRDARGALREGRERRPQAELIERRRTQFRDDRAKVLDLAA
jgi:hypothetical protein